MATIFIVGLGINIPGHITSEATNALAVAQRVFTIVKELPSLWMPRGYVERGTEIVNVLSMYVEGAPRDTNYQKVAQLILGSASKLKAVAYATYGNPLAYDSVSQNIVEQAKAFGHSVHIIPGISSIDTLLCDLRTDMAPGIQIYDATWLVTANIILRKDAAAILLQIGAFGSFRTRYQRPPLLDDLELLFKHLESSYPPSHLLSLIRSGNRPKEPRNITTFKLSDYLSLEHHDLINASLFIPCCSSDVFQNCQSLEK